MSDGLPSAEFRQTLRKVFKFKKPEVLEKPAPLPIHDVPQEIVKDIEDIGIVAEAQRIFNPSLPPVPSKPPASKQIEKGTAANLDLSGNWGGKSE